MKGHTGQSGNRNRKQTFVNVCFGSWPCKNALPRDEPWHISAGSTIIDGEVVVPGENGATDFSVLQNEVKGKSLKIFLVAFDLLLH
jgi:hypothetical protein